MHCVFLLTAEKPQSYSRQCIYLTLYQNVSVNVSPLVMKLVKSVFPIRDVLTEVVGIL